MNSHFGQYGSFGESSTVDTLLQAVPGVSALLEKVADPVREVQNLQVKLSQAKARGASLQEIQEIEGKLIAAQRRVDLQLSRERSSAQWSNLGKIAAVGGILLVGSLIVFVGVKTVRTAGGKK